MLLISWKILEGILLSCPKILPWQARQRLEKRGYCVRGTKVGMVRHSVGPNYACVGMFLSWMQQQQHVLPLWLVVVLYWRGSTANPHIWVMFSPTHETRTIDTVLAIITINYSILTRVLYIYIIHITLYRYGVDVCPLNQQNSIWDWKSSCLVAAHVFRKL